MNYTTFTIDVCINKSYLRLLGIKLTPLTLDRAGEIAGVLRGFGSH